MLDFVHFQGFYTEKKQAVSRQGFPLGLPEISQIQKTKRLQKLSAVTQEVVVSHILFTDIKGLNAF